MPFVEDLLQGLSSAAGSDFGVNTIQKRKDQRKQLSDLELENQTQQILGDVQTLNDRRSKLDPNSPTYKQDLQTIDQALHDARQVFTDLYHPQNNPGALQKFGGFLKSHLGKNRGQAPATPAAAKASIGDRIAGIESAAYAPQAAPDAFAAANAAFKRATGRDMTSEERQQWAYKQSGLPQAKPEAENWIPQNVKLANGQEVTLQRNTKDGRWTNLDGSEVSAETLRGASVLPNKPPQQAKPIRAWTKDKSGKVYSILLDPQTNKEIPGSENYDLVPPSTMTGRISTGQYHFVDEKGQVHEVTETRTSMPAPGASAPSPVKTPADARKRIAGNGTGDPRDRIIGRHLTAPQGAAQKKYQEAVGLVAVADQVATHPHDAVNQKRLAVQLERLSAGRFTTEALKYIIKAGWGNTIQQWANNVTTGELPPDIVRQLVDGAKENLSGAEAEMKASGLTVPDSDLDAIIKALNSQKKPQ